jgi:hypothetical protein
MYIRVYVHICMYIYTSIYVHIHMHIFISRFSGANLGCISGVNLGGMDSSSVEFNQGGGLYTLPYFSLIYLAPMIASLFLEISLTYEFHNSEELQWIFLELAKVCMYVYI